jgi:putative addiction module component (TIGR02574 family)
VSGGIFAMSISNIELFKHAMNLSENERAALAGLLISSLEDEPHSDLEEIWRREISRRVSELDAESVTPVSWDDVKKETVDDRQ